MLYSKTKIKTHFSRLQSPYASRANWFWKTMRNKEKALFCKLVQDLNKKICLDLGAGSCEYSKILLQMGSKKSVCVDFSSSLLSGETDSRIEKIITDVENYETKVKYDLILCLGILEYLEKPENFLLRVSGFLKPEGKIVILLPLSGFWSLGYGFLYLMRGISIHLITLKKVNHFLIQKGFRLNKTATDGLFSGFSVYSLPETKDKITWPLHCKP